MKTLKIITTPILLIITLGASSIANAALVARDLDGDLSTTEAYYDNEANLTWLADANYAKTTGFDSDGYMLWQIANDWAANLTVGSVSGWRLASTLQPDAGCDTQGANESYGFNCTGSEMGNLFYNVLGNTVGSLVNTGPFSNVQTRSGFGYWSATEYVALVNYAWIFDMSNGYQIFGNIGNGFSAWAVQSGDVGASVVPVPAAAWLFGSGLLGLVAAARRKKPA